MTVVGIIALVVLGLPATIYLFVVVHHALDRIIVRHVRRYCGENGLRIARVRWMPAFKSGVKTEFTLVQVDCYDAQDQRRLMDFVASPFGVRKVIGSDFEKDSIEQKWPQDRPEGGYNRK